MNIVTKDKKYISTKIVEKLNPGLLKQGFNLKPTVFSNQNVDIQFELFNENKQIIYSTRTSANTVVEFEMH